MSALPAHLGLSEVMPIPPAGGRLQLGRSPLDLIAKQVRTSPRARCPKSFAIAGIWHHSTPLKGPNSEHCKPTIAGRWAVVVEVPCQQWPCPVCGQRKARYYAGIARAGCALSTERIRLLTISCPRETPAESWAQLGPRWNRLAERLARRLTPAGAKKLTRLSYFGTVELQKRGNPHLHILMRDTGYIPKAVVHALGHAVGFGFSDIRQIQPGAGVVYVTKYLHKSAGQVLPKGVNRIRRSRDWYTPPPRPKCTWGDEWAWQSLDGFDPDYIAGDLAAKGYEVVHYAQRPDAAD